MRISIHWAKLQSIFPFTEDGNSSCQGEDWRQILTINNMTLVWALQTDDLTPWPHFLTAHHSIPRETQGPKVHLQQNHAWPISPLHWLQKNIWFSNGHVLQMRIFPTEIVVVLERVSFGVIMARRRSSSGKIPLNSSTFSWMLLDKLQTGW